jgi:hypothetical protein
MISHPSEIETRTVEAAREGWKRHSAAKDSFRWGFRLRYKRIMAVRRLKNIAGTETEFVLEVETEEFERRQAELKKKFPGKIVIFRGKRLAGAFDTMDEAIREAEASFGTVPCLIRRVDAPPLSRASFAFRLD